MSKRISVEKVRELHEKKKQKEEEQKKKIEKHIKKKARLKTFLINLKLRYKETGRQDLEQAVDVEEE